MQTHLFLLIPLLIPFGEIRKVKGTPFDFTKGKKLVKKLIMMINKLKMVKVMTTVGY